MDINHSLFSSLPLSHLWYLTTASSLLQAVSAMQVSRGTSPGALASQHSIICECQPAVRGAAWSIRKPDALDMHSIPRSRAACGASARQAARRCHAANLSAAHPASAPTTAADTALGSAAWRQFADAASGDTAIVGAARFPNSVADNFTCGLCGVLALTGRQIRGMAAIQEVPKPQRTGCTRDLSHLAP